MRKFVAAAVMAVLVSPAFSHAAPRDAAIGGPTAAPSSPAAEGMRIAMRRETLPPGGKLGDHRQDGERYVYVLTGQLKVSNLVTGDEQVVEAGKMAAEQPGDWYAAEAVGTEAATFYLIDRAPAPASPAVASGN